jgi:hypothetical protein
MTPRGMTILMLMTALRVLNPITRLTPLTILQDLPRIQTETGTLTQRNQRLGQTHMTLQTILQDRQQIQITTAYRIRKMPIMTTTVTRTRKNPRLEQTRTMKPTIPPNHRWISMATVILTLRKRELARTHITLQIILRTNRRQETETASPSPVMEANPAGKTTAERA